MASTSQSQDETFEDAENDSGEAYGNRLGIIFVIDATPPMFTKDPKEEITFFQLCFREYIDILRDKLVWSSQDWMGVMLFGTEKWDMDPEIKNVLTLQKLNVISVNDLKNAMEIVERKWEYYKEISSSTSYPLHDVLWHAAQAFTSLKVTMPKRRVILLTCRSDPPLNKDEKHMVVKKVESCVDLKIQLNVIRLGDNWENDHFYKDLEILAGKIKEEDHRPVSFTDLIDQVKRPSRIIASLPLNFGEDVTLDVQIQSISTKPKCLKKVHLDKETHTPLEPHRYYKTRDYEDDEGGEDNEDYADEDDEYIPLPDLKSEIQKYVTCGGKDIYFTPAEVRSLGNIGPPGIDVIASMPVKIDPLYHMEAPKLVTCAKSTRPDNKLLFAAILRKCEVRNLMLICCLTLRETSRPLRYNMIPNAKNGGFYLYRIPYKDEVRGFADETSKYIYDDDNKPPVDQNLVDGFTKIIRKMKVEYDPAMFTNPKLQVQIHNLETLALDLEQRDPPVDMTLPIPEIVEDRVGDLVDELKQLLKAKGVPDEPAVKKRKQASVIPVSDESMRELAEKRKVATCTVAQLKDFLKSKDLKYTGTKTELIDRVYAYYA